MFNFESMPEHDAALLTVALVLGSILVIAVLIEYYFQRREDDWLAEFADPVSHAELEEQKERFWRFVNDAENMRLIHLSESEAAAIQQTIQQANRTTREV